MDTLQLIGLGVGTALLCVAVAHFWRQGQVDVKQKTRRSPPPSTPTRATPSTADARSGEAGSVDDDREFEDKETGEKRKAASTTEPTSLRKRRKDLLEQARVSRSPGADNSGELNAMLQADKGDPLGLWKGKPSPVNAQARVQRRKKSNRPPIPAFAQLIDDEVQNASPAQKERKVGQKAPGRDTAQEDIDELFATVRDLSDSGEPESLKPIRKKPRNNARPGIPSFDAFPTSDDDNGGDSSKAKARPGIPSFDAPGGDSSGGKAKARPGIPSFSAAAASDSYSKPKTRPGIPSFDPPSESESGD